MIYTHVTQDSACGIKSPLTRVRKIQTERHAAVQKSVPSSAPEPSRLPSQPTLQPPKPIATDRHPKTPLVLLKRIGIAALWTIACLMGKRTS